MSRENLDMVRRLFEAWKEGPQDVPSDLIAPDVEFTSPLTNLRGRPYRGYEGAREWLHDVNEQFEVWEYALDQMREVDDGVLVFGRVHLEGRGSGVALDQEGAWLVRFAEDGRVNRMHIYTDRDEALKAAGLAE